MIFAYHVAVKCRRYAVRLKAMSLVLVYFGGIISVRFGPVTISTLLRPCPSTPLSWFGLLSKRAEIVWIPVFQARLVFKP